MNQLEIRLADERDSDALCMLCYEFHEYHVRGVPSRLRSLGNIDQQDWSRLRKLLGDIYKNDDAALFVAKVLVKWSGLPRSTINRMTEPIRPSSHTAMAICRA